jgi:O-antigen ligase
MTAAGASPAPRSPFLVASVGLLAALPVVAVFSSRSGPLMISLAAAAALGASASEGRLAHDTRRLGQALVSPLGLLALSFLAWALASIAWSPFPRASLHAWGEFVLPVAAASVLGVTLPGRLSRLAVWTLAAGVALAAILILIELATGLGLRNAMGLRAVTFIFNRPVLTACLLAIPLASLLAAAGHRWAAAGLLALAAAATARSESGAAVLALIVAAGVYGVARAAPRLTLWLAAAAITAALLAAPFMGSAAERLLPPKVHDNLASTSSRARVEIWKVFGAAALQRPLIGSGFGTSPRAHETPAARWVTGPNAKLLAVGHPHNAPLQIWTETGLVGILLVLAILLRTLMSVAAHAPRERAPILALTAAILAVSLVGHGAWQGWWPAAIGVAVVLFLHARALKRPAHPEISS